MQEALRRIGKRIDRKTPALGIRSAILGQGGIDPGGKIARRTLKFVIPGFGHNGQPKVQRLKLGHGHVERGQGDRSGHAIALPAIAFDGNTGSDQRIHVAVNSARRHLQALGQILGPHQAATAHQLDQFQKAVRTFHDEDMTAPDRIMSRKAHLGRESGFPDSGRRHI